MPEIKETHDLLDVAKVLLRCFFLGCLLLLLWAGCYLLAGDLLYRINGPLFGLTQHEMNLMHFYGIVFVKCLVLLFFPLPIHCHPVGLANGQRIVASLIAVERSCFSSG